MFPFTSKPAYGRHFVIDCLPLYETVKARTNFEGDFNIWQKIHNIEFWLSTSSSKKIIYTVNAAGSSLTDVTALWSLSKTHLS